MNRFLFKKMVCVFLILLVLGNICAFGKEITMINQASNPYAGSRVVFDGPQYERDEVLEVAGEPFFYNGIQIRIDKVVDWYHFDNAKVKRLFEIAKNDGYTVVNCQIRWMDVQQDQSFKAKESAYIRGGVYANQTFNTGGIQTFYEEGNESNQALAYVKFDISGWTKGDIEGARIRLYSRNSLTYGHYVSVYGCDDTPWSKDTITWNNAPGHSGYTVLGEKLSQTPSWDEIKSANYYDFDVTDYVEKARREGKREVSFIIKSTTPSGNEPGVPIVFDDFDDNRPPQIFLSSEDEYDWEYLDRIIGYAEEYGLKLEVLWFATDTCSLSTDIRVPYYVLRNYQKQVYSVGTPWLKKATAGNDITGLYQFIMCKNDMELRKKEYEALNTVFNHIGEYNATHGYKNTVVGCQVCNEPNVSRLHNGSVYENGVKLENCQCNTCVTLKQNGGFSHQGFRDWTMFEYCNNLAKAVKKSSYPVWTRVNNVNGTDAWGVDYNEAKRASGGTDTDSGTYLDFIGLDPYGWNRNQLYNFGTGSYSNGRNLPMVMECGGENSMSALMMLATVAGGAFYNVYDLCSPDGHGMYDQNLNPRVIGAGDKYLPNGGTYIEDVRNHNHWLNKIAHPLAVMKPDKAGGKNLMFFNCEGTDISNINVTKMIDGLYITYKSDTIYSSGIAFKKSSREVVLLSSKDTDATFTLADIANDVKTVEFGHYEKDKWVKDEGVVSYTRSGNNLVVTMPSFSVVRVETYNDLPKPAVFEGENLVNEGKVTLSAGVTKRNVAESGASNNGWACFENMASGSYITFSVDVPENLSKVRVATKYKAKNSGRANFYLSINGVRYGQEVNATAAEGFYQTSFGPIIELKSGTNTFTYTATSSGLIGIDCICLMAVTESMPEQLSGTVLIENDFSNADPQNFGFDKGASISGGTLNITKSMGNYTTSVKWFDANIINQTEIELSFDWKTNVNSNGKKSGIEFRDMYGRLIFALASKSGTIFRHSCTGYDSDSSHCEYDWEPKWTEEAMDRNKTYQIRLRADFKEKIVSYQVKEKDTGLIIAQVTGAPIQASNLAKMVAANYYTNEYGVSYEGTQNIDNFVLIGKEGNIALPYKDKTDYAFGDSIIDGHKYTKMGFVEFVALKCGMNLTYNGAQNGASVLGGNIKAQVLQAPAASPHVVIFDGGINDAYSTTNLAQYENAFSDLVQTMKSKWPDAEIIYVAVHKTRARDLYYQSKIFEISYNVCRKNNVKVADLYNSSLDTNIQELRWKYSFDDLGSDNLPGNMGTVSSEKFSDSYPTGTHPNFLAVEEFYVPAVTEALLDKNNTGFTAWGFVEGGQLKVHAKTDSGVLVLALYVDRGLLSASVFTGSITVPYREEITKIKVFNWDRLQTLIPLNNYIDIDPFFFS